MWVLKPLYAILLLLLLLLLMMLSKLSVAHTDSYPVFHNITENQAEKHVISGQVLDKKTRVALSGVQVVVKSLNKRTTTDKNGAELVLNPAIEQDLLLGSGKAYGIEFLVRKNTGKVNGWVAYTWSRSKIRLNGTFPYEILNNRKYYPSSLDKPHDFSVVLNYKISQSAQLSAGFVYSTGRPATLPEQKYDIDNLTIVSFSERNKYRLPDYHRLNFSFRYSPMPKKCAGLFSVIFSIAIRLKIINMTKRPVGISL